MPPVTPHGASQAIRGPIKFQTQYNQDYKGAFFYNGRPIYLNNFYAPLSGPGLTAAPLGPSPAGCFSARGHFFIMADLYI